LGELLDEKLQLVPDCIGDDVAKMVDGFEDGDMYILT